MIKKVKWIDGSEIVLLDFGTMEYDRLKKAIEFEQRTVVVYGREYAQPRLTKWYGEVDYEYSGLRWEACLMPTILEELRKKIQEEYGLHFNSVLCNLYRDGNDRIGWHSDDEAIFGNRAIVGSISFGASRTFKLRGKNELYRKKYPDLEYELTDGSFLVMGAGIQDKYQHSIDRVKEAGERINLTFRTTK